MKFKKYDRINLYNPRQCGFGKKQFLIMDDKSISMAVQPIGCSNSPTGIIPQMCLHYAVLLNDKIKYIPEHEIQRANPFFRVGDRVLCKNDVEGNIYTICHFNKENVNKVLLSYGNGSREEDINNLEFLQDHWVQYCESKYRDIVLPQGKQKKIKRGVGNGSK